MPDTEIGRLLVYAEEQFEPSAEFVERLSVELAAVAGPVSAPPARPKRLAVSFGLAAAVVTVFLGLAFAFWPQDPAPNPPVADQPIGTVPTDAEVGNPVPLSVSQACRSFLIEVAPVLRSGQTQTVGYATALPSRNGVVGAAASVYEMRDSLGRVSEWYSGDTGSDPVVIDGLSNAVGEFGRAALFLQLGENEEAQRHIESAKAHLSDLADDPRLAPCFGL